MGVYEAHGATLEQIKQYDSVYTMNDFSIAEYKKHGEGTILNFSHSHLEYEFILPIKTIPLLIYDKANYIGEVGYAYPVNPNVTHGIEFNLDQSHCIDITASLEYVEEIKERLGYQGKYFYTRFLVPTSLLDIIHRFQQEFDKKKPDSLQLNVLKDAIVSSLVELGLASGEDNRRPEKEYRKNMRNIILYMNDHFTDKDLNIEKLAELSGFSSAYFSKSFKVYMRDTPITHLNKLRISEAKYLMSLGNDKFGEIADKVGYSNLSTFTEAFKTITGFTPTEYRNQFIKK